LIGLALEGLGFRRHGLGGAGLSLGEFILELRHFLLQLGHAATGGISIRFGGLVGWGIVKQRIPLFPCLMEIQGWLPVECETEQKQAGYRCHGRYGEAHV
jgi:hypothetical protein